MEKVKISAVSYLNTLPFIRGLKKSGLADAHALSLDIPAECARKLLTGEVDLGLVPVAIIPQLNNHRVISDWCIGAAGPVKSVVLLSEVPLDKIETILLDYQSRTSVQLVQLLAKECWNIQPQWQIAEPGFEQKINGATAGVVIGDRVFDLLDKYPYVYDLAEEWIKHTGEHFVFAAWVANKQLPEAFITQFNKALALGVAEISELINEQATDKGHERLLHEYFTQNISYQLDERKKRGMDRFLQYISTQTQQLALNR
jgi:chorismate dehydratase